MDTEKQSIQWNDSWQDGAADDPFGTRPSDAAALPVGSKGIGFNASGQNVGIRIGENTILFHPGYSPAVPIREPFASRAPVERKAPMSGCHFCPM